MQTIVIKRMDEKELEKKTESDVDRSDQEVQYMHCYFLLEMN